MRRLNRRRHASTSPVMTNWLIDHRQVEISVETDGHIGPVDLVIELDRDSRQITSWEIVPRPTDGPTTPRTENPD
jgi:hypothetical protein